MMLMVLGDWWSELANVDKFFWGVSIIFSVLFVIQFVLSLVGLDFDHDADHDVDFSADADHDLSVDHDFTILSVRSFIAFFTFFGWTGVLILRGGGSSLSAIALGSLAGFVSMLIVGYIMYLFTKLQQDGTLDFDNAIFEEGEVYLSIPANEEGSGKIHIELQGSLRELPARSRDGVAIKTGTKIRVVEVLEDHTLIVEPVNKFLL